MQYEQSYETSSDDYHYSRHDVQGHGPRCQHAHDVSPVQYSPPLHAEFGLRQRQDIHGNGPRCQQSHDVSPVQHSSPCYVEYGGFR